MAGESRRQELEASGHVICTIKQQHNAMNISAFHFLKDMAPSQGMMPHPVAVFST